MVGCFLPKIDKKRAQFVSESVSCCSCAGSNRHQHETTPIAFQKCPFRPQDGVFFGRYATILQKYDKSDAIIKHLRQSTTLIPSVQETPGQCNTLTANNAIRQHVCAFFSIIFLILFILFCCFSYLLPLLSTPEHFFSFLSYLFSTGIPFLFCFFIKLYFFRHHLIPSFFWTVSSPSQGFSSPRPPPPPLSILFCDWV